MKKTLSKSYMFLYQLLISCWLADITNPNDLKKILDHAIKKYNVLPYRKNTRVTDHTLWVFSSHIRKHIPSLRLIDNTVYGEKVGGNNNKYTPAFKMILTFERILPSDPNNPVFRKLYPTDSILEVILDELGIIKKQE